MRFPVDVLAVARPMNLCRIEARLLFCKGETQEATYEMSPCERVGSSRYPHFGRNARFEGLKHSSSVRGQDVSFVDRDIAYQERFGTIVPNINYLGLWKSGFLQGLPLSISNIRQLWHLTLLDDAAATSGDCLLIWGGIEFQ
jgi:hypothetical protein